MPEIGKKLSDLRVCDLKGELEKRKLESSGSKAALLERLEQALKREGSDPVKYVFKTGKATMTPKKAVVKKAAEELIENIQIKEEPIDEDEIPMEEAEAGDYNDNEGLEANGDDEIDQVGDVDDECMIVGEGDGNEEGEELNNSLEPVVEEENAGESNEESINLTIGEEEQKLLHDEAPDDKEKNTDAEGTNTGGGQMTTQKNNKNATNAKDNKTPKNVSNSSKDERKSNSSKTEDDKSKKKDEKSNEKKDKDESDHKTSSSKTAQKDDKEKSSTNTTKSSAAKQSTPSRNLWVSGLSSLTRASDLKTIFSKYGKVIGAKVVTNTRTPGTRCYGYVTMSSSTDATRCIEQLHHTELHGRIISVERTKNEIGGSNSTHATNKARLEGTKKEDDKKSHDRSSKSRDDKRKATESGKKDESSKKSSDVEKEKRRDVDKEKDTKERDDKTKEKEKDKDKENEKEKENEKDKEKEKEKEKGKDKEKEKDKDDKSVGNNRDRRALSREGPRGDRNIRRGPNRSRSNERIRGIRNIRDQRQRDREREQRIRQRQYIQLREERERQRLRERERELREEERRRREIRERQRQEEARLAEERRKLAQERERLEKEKAELLRLERERQKLEREKIELERLELKRQQMKIIHSREDPIKRLSKRTSDDRYPEVSERKRTSGTDSRFEGPPPPRFDATLLSTSRSYDKKRDDYTGSSSKRGIDDFSSSSKRIDYSSKRDDYTSSGTKRPALEDFTVVASKRSADDYNKRSSDYITSSSSSKRILDDYGTSKSSRDDYKREVEIRHVPAMSNNGGSSFHSSRDISTSIHKSSSNRYADSDRASGNYRRGGGGGGIDDLRSSVSGNKRYDNSNGYGNSNSVGNIWASNHLGGSSGASSGIKSYMGNGMSSLHTNSAWQKPVEDNSWRQTPSTQDRFDRTYNERSNSGYTAGGLFGGGSGRYGGQMSRY